MSGIPAALSATLCRSSGHHSVDEKISSMDANDVVTIIERRRSKFQKQRRSGPLTPSGIALQPPLASNLHAVGPPSLRDFVALPFG